MTEATTGRRERKKARTRQAIADAALELFLERGFDQVAVKDVAEAADVSMSGLFKHFPTKESLVFDEEDDVQAGLISSVRDRPEGTSVLEALRAWLLARVCNKSADPRVAEFLDLVAHTPALSDYARRMWLRHEEELAKAIRQSGPDAPGADIAARAVARFVLDRTQPWQRDDPRAELDAAFTLLTHGRPAPELHATPHPPPSAAPPSPARPSGLRERKKAQTRQAITTTALELFAAHGYDNVGVREIADAAAPPSRPCSPTSPTARPAWSSPVTGAHTSPPWSAPSASAHPDRPSCERSTTTWPSAARSNRTPHPTSDACSI